MSVSALPRKSRTDKILHFFLSVVLLNLNGAQKHILFTFFDTLADILSNCFLFQLPAVKLLEMSIHCAKTQAWRRFLHALTAVSIMLCSRQMQTSPVVPEFINIPEHHLVDALLHDS